MNISRQNISAETKKLLIEMQVNELTEYYIYTNIARHVKDEHNKGVLTRIAQEEKAHADFWQAVTNVAVKPKKFKIFFNTLMSRILGFTFVLKLMESGETNASGKYERLGKEIPEALKIAEDEDRHEQDLLNMLDEERLQYAGSMVLGLNDALVELSGTLAGLTFALQNNRLVALSGLITGIAATLSMGSSEYLSSRSEGKTDAFKSCLYTAGVYLVTVVLLVLPYLLFSETEYIKSLIVMICTVVVIIFLFTYYISVAKNLPFKRRFGEMAGISLTVATISFGIGLLVKHFLGIEI